MHDTSMTWAGLVARWTDFAQASLALPDDAEGQRWKDAVPAIIGLQAVTCALGELASLEPVDRAAALDIAEVSRRAHTGALHDLWDAEPLPEAVAELIDDGQAAVESARHLAIQWVLMDHEPAVLDHPGEFAEGLASVAGADTVLRLAAPGVAVMPGSVVASVHRPGARAVPDDVVMLLDAWLARQASTLGVVGHCAAAQVYRQFDFAAGGPVRDVIAPAHGEALAGQPLLVTVIEAGRVQPVSLPPRGPADVGILEVEDRVGLADDDG